MGTRRNYRRGRGRSGYAGLVLFLLVAVAAGVLLTSTVFVIKDIQVVGNMSVPTPDIVRLSGLEMGTSVFRINADNVKSRFDGVGRVGFEGLNVSYPSTVTIYVRERIGRVLVNYSGLPTVLDEFGYAIEQSREMPSGDLPVVTGLRATGCQVGHQIQSDVVGQVDAMNKVVSRLYQLQYQGLISELNVSDLDNLYLMTRSGMMVKLGDSEQLESKLIWMNSALGELMKDGKTAGIVNVSGGSSAVYQPTTPVEAGQ